MTPSVVQSVITRRQQGAALETDGKVATQRAATKTARRRRRRVCISKVLRTRVSRLLSGRNRLARLSSATMRIAFERRALLAPTTLVGGALALLVAAAVFF